MFMLFYFRVNLQLLDYVEILVSNRYEILGD